MVEQVEFLKSVRQSVVAVQAKASERFGVIEGEARKVIDGLVERGKDSLPGARARVEGLQRRARGQAAVVAGELRKLADRLEKIAEEPAKAEEPVAAAVEQPEESAEVQA